MLPDLAPCCLITGCAGNVGSNVTKALLDKGSSVVGIDNFSSGMPSNMADFQGHPGFSFFERSITDKDFLSTLFTGREPFTAVIHLAAIISVPYSMDHPEETMAINHLASLDLHERARLSGCGSFVFAGSAAEYGRPLFGPAREQDAGDPLSPYGLSKYLVSTAIGDSGYGCSLRFFNLYGPTRAKPGPYDGVVRKFLERTGQGLAPIIFGDGRQMRDFVYLGNAVTALGMAAGFEGVRPLAGVFNVGTGHGTTVQDLAELTMRLAGQDGRPEYQPERPGDIVLSVADNTRLKQATGWVPDVALAEGLSRTRQGMAKLAAMPAF